MAEQVDKTVERPILNRSRGVVFEETHFEFDEGDPLADYDMTDVDVEEYEWKPVDEIEAEIELDCEFDSLATPAHQDMFSHVRQPAISVIKAYEDFPQVHRYADTVSSPEMIDLYRGVSEQCFDNLLIASVENPVVQQTYVEKSLQSPKKKVLADQRHCGSGDASFHTPSSSDAPPVDAQIPTTSSTQAENLVSEAFLDVSRPERKFTMYSRKRPVDKDGGDTGVSREKIKKKLPMLLIYDGHGAKIYNDLKHSSLLRSFVLCVTYDQMQVALEMEHSVLTFGCCFSQPNHLEFPEHIAVYVTPLKRVSQRISELVGLPKTYSLARGLVNFSVARMLLTYFTYLGHQDPQRNLEGREFGTKLKHLRESLDHKVVPPPRNLRSRKKL